MADDLGWFAGVDWASETHQVTLLDALGTVIGEHAFLHGGAGLGALCEWLLAATGAPAETTSGANEGPHRTVAETILERGFLAYAIYPKPSERIHDRIPESCPKGEPLDSLGLCESQNA